MQLGRDIARVKRHLVHEFDLKRTQELAAILRVWNKNFYILLQIYFGYSNKTWKYVARGKRHLVCEFVLKRPWPLEMVAIFMVWNHIFVLFSKSISVFPTPLGGDIVRGKGQGPRISPQKILTSENGDHFTDLKLHFCTFSGPIYILKLQNGMKLFFMVFGEFFCFFKVICNF